MYRKHPEATPIDLQEGLIGWMPPKGVLWDHFTNKWVKTEIFSRSRKKSDQYWEPEKEPDWYRKKRREEERTILNTENPDFYIEECMSYRQDQWFKRLNGFWFMNNGVAIYITGLHWFYLTHWRIDIGLPNYLGFDRPRFYHIKYVVDDPLSFGRVEVGPRRTGKTFVGGICVYEPISRTENAVGTLQSKTGPDGKEVLGKAIVSPFIKLPHFFRPVFDTSAGPRPKSEIRFYYTSKKGKNISVEDYEDELESIIDYKSSAVRALDGRKVQAVLVDEAFKTEEVNIYDRHKVIRECLVDKMTGKIIGKEYCTSTVEEVAKELETYEKFWNDSDPSDRDGNGHTKTGLYRYFISIADSMIIDKYGNADRAKNIQIIQNTVDGFKDSQKDVSDYRRKHPLTIKDAFRPRSTDCQYNLELLENRYDILSILEPKYITGDLRWINPDNICEGVKFVPTKNGNFKLHKDIDYNSGQWNNVDINGSVPNPRSKAKFIGGNDSFDNKTTVDNRKSNGSTVIFYKFDAMNEKKSDKFVLIYCFRPKKPSIFYEDTLKIAWFFGCQILIESNKQGIIQYFEWSNPFGLNLTKFMVHLPDRQEPGIPTTGQTHDSIVNHTREYIEDCIDLVDYPELITDWTKFDINNTTKFDLSMSSGICLIAADRIKKRKVAIKDKITEISEIFPVY